MRPIKFNYEYDRKIKAGFIGCGAHAFRNVYPTFDYAPVDLVAVCDLNAERAEIYRKRFGAENIYTDYKEMIKQEKLDAVFVVLNFDKEGRPMYPRIVPDLLEAGLPVWMEKPAAYTADEVERMLEVEERSGQFVLVANKRYFYPTFEKAKQIIGLEGFGQPVSINGRYPLTLSPYQEDIATRTGLHWFQDICHPMSGIHFLMGEVKEMCFIEHQPSGNVQALLQFKSGGIGNLQLASTQAPTSPLERFEVIGSNQNVVIDNGMRLIYYKGSKGSGEYGKAPVYIGDDPADGPVLWEPEFSLGQVYNKNLFLQGMVQSVSYFANAVLEGKKIERSTLRDSLHLTKIFDAFKQRSGKWITIG
ncbi:Gfo/Idh/MocA family protein [Paenibacillus sabinae]|uniref:GFO/IDH/MocA family dehydrogenase n=1 Tax=Paenibacillus sabinae T27 TaxID=1268072 RepID=X5A530_9BACL|nr:Gfo/Idh/MocA family oxidoreductase [Paenibacillus sabinae]AHV98904.1 GFO/IDH/MocA family dehydrogenase [Paenibacillus sabinae T27]